MNRIIQSKHRDSTRNLPRSPKEAQDRILRRLNRKERKERRDSGQKERGLALAAGPVLPLGKLAHLELIVPEVDQQTVFETGGLQATKHNDWIRLVVE